LVSDQEYDELFQELKALEEKHPEFASPNSPTSTVGAPSKEKRTDRRRPHQEPMLSLNNAFTKEQLHAFFKRIDKALTTSLGSSEKPPYVVELKYDGIALSLIYRFVKGHFYVRLFPFV